MSNSIPVYRKFGIDTTKLILNKKVCGIINISNDSFYNADMKMKEYIEILYNQSLVYNVHFTNWLLVDKEVIKECFTDIPDSENEYYLVFTFSEYEKEKEHISNLIDETGIPVVVSYCVI